MAGLYPGDSILEVNGQDVKYAPVEDVVEVIMGVSKSNNYKERSVCLFTCLFVCLFVCCDCCVVQDPIGGGVCGRGDASQLHEDS